MTVATATVYVVLRNRPVNVTLFSTICFVSGVKPGALITALYSTTGRAENGGGVHETVSWSAQMSLGVSAVGRSGRRLAI